MLTASRVPPLAFIAILMAADVVSTKMVLARGGVEANPFAQALLSHGALSAGKVLVICALCASLFIPGRRWITTALWFLTGAYFAVAVSNFLLLRVI